MRAWRLLLTRRWLGYLAFVIAFAVACVLLSNWQLARRAEAVAEIERVEANWDAPPAALASVLPDPGAWSEDAKYRPVSLTGTYRTDEQLLVRGRPLDGRVGFEVLVPLELADGRVFLVDRGWVPAGNAQDAPDAVPTAPAGPVDVVVRLKATEPTVPGRSAPPGQVATIHLPTIAGLVDGDLVTGAYGLLASEDPAPAQRPVAATRPAADEGPHLSYAFQWIAFALLGFTGLAWAVRLEYRALNADAPDVRAAAARRSARAARRERSDAEVEDELLGG